MLLIAVGSDTEYNLLIMSQTLNFKLTFYGSDIEVKLVFYCMLISKETYLSNKQTDSNSTVTLMRRKMNS